MAKLSVIIVNYNVKYFLKQCLISVNNASKNIDTETFVVDNASADGSVDMVKREFPWVKLIANTQNVGFSTANNQAIKQATGEYILLLNPDTFVQEDTFEKIIKFMDTHPQAGGLGVKMIDGNGNFLPESKRGIPTPLTAFYKMFGLYKLFPRSKIFNRYYLGHLNENETNEVEILAGAFMLLRKKVLDKIGLLDETFFMYGEDIDLSYRILQAGYKNYYYPETQIIHYKGESTKKGSLNYIRIFYKAMKIFVDKHFPKNKFASIYKIAINIAIIFRAFLAIINRFAKSILLPMLDFVLIYGGYVFLLIPYWEHFYHKAQYPETYKFIILPIYVIIWQVALFVNGAYDKPITIKNAVKGILWGLLLILIFYSLLDSSLRFSRALIFLGSLWAILSVIIIRQILSYINPKEYKLAEKQKKQIAVIGSTNDNEKIKQFLNSLNLSIEYKGYIATEENHIQTDDFLGTLKRIKDIIAINKINEVIFSPNSLSASDIIHLMTLLSPFNMSFKIASPDGLSVVGSNDVNTNGEIYIVSLNTVNSPKNKRIKRLFDLSFALLFLIFSPILIFKQKNTAGFFRNVFDVLIGKKSWIGVYTLSKSNQDNKNYNIKKGIFTPLASHIIETLPPSAIEKINLNYIQNYSILNDFTILMQNLSNLDN